MNRNDAGDGQETFGKMRDAIVVVMAIVMVRSQWRRSDRDDVIF